MGSRIRFRGRSGYPLALLGKATIAMLGIATLMEYPVVRCLSYFRCLVPGYRLSEIPFPGIMVTSNVMTYVPTLACLMLRGSSPSTVGISSEMGASSTLPWINRSSRKKELVAASHAPVVSHVSERLEQSLVLFLQPRRCRGYPLLFPE